MACVISSLLAGIGWPSEASHRSHHLAGARRRRDVRGPVAPQPVEHQPDEAPPGLGCRRSGALDDAGIGHQQQDHILGDDISPEGSLVLCPLDQANRGGHSRAVDGPPASSHRGTSWSDVLEPSGRPTASRRSALHSRRDRSRRCPPRSASSAARATLPAGARSRRRSDRRARETGGSDFADPDPGAFGNGLQCTSRSSPPNAAWAASTIRPRLRSASMRSGLVGSLRSFIGRLYPKSEIGLRL